MSGSIVLVVAANLLEWRLDYTELWTCLGCSLAPSTLASYTDAHALPLTRQKHSHTAVDLSRLLHRAYTRCAHAPTLSLPRALQQQPWVSHPGV